MSCCRPFIKYNKLTHSFDSIPCGWCISCRIDKRMYYKTRFDYSLYKEHKGVGAFVCLTYDDFNIPLNSFSEPTLEKSACVKFIKRLRSYLKYHDLYDGTFLQKDWKYIAVGEYSDDGRPHYHLLFSGLDYQYIEPVLRKCWKNAIIIDSRPILDGGVNYVLKYIDKQQHGSELEEQYYDVDKEPPFFNVSKGFGFNVYKDFDPVNLTFKYGAKNIPLPPYIKRRLCLQKPRELSQKVRDFALKNRMSYDKAQKYLVESSERFYHQKMRQSGEPIARIPFDGEFDSLVTHRLKRFYTFRRI